MSGYLGDLPEDGGPNQGRAPGSGVPSPTVAAQLGIDYAELRAEVQELRDQLQGILDGQTEQDTTYADLRARVEELHTSLKVINENLAQGQTEGADTEPPADWQHVPEKERVTWMNELQEWVRDTLFVQWPHTQEQLRWCWPLHMGIVSDLWLLYRGYLKGFDAKDRRFADAEHWRRLLDYLLKQARETTGECPDFGGEDLHPIPDMAGRDDSAVSSLVPVMSELLQAYGCYVEAGKHLDAAQHPDTQPDLREQHEHYAERFMDRCQGIVRSAGVTTEQWELFIVLQQGKDKETENDQ